jgi:2-polyprenyl-3-methyl-5-hydroxy-6-metoxy-1,4-benzoquinol methylase
MSPKEHWEQVYSSKPTEKLGWFAPHLQTSFSWITELGMSLEAPIIDVGGGACTLVDDLLDAGYRSITVLDLSQQALSLAKTRLAKNADAVSWIAGDVTATELPEAHFELWHDRAVFHFLTEPEQQRKYRDQLLKALKPDGHLIIGTFAPEAPSKCSGLPVQRYSSERLESTLGDEFELQRQHNELHVTPGGVEQMYLYCQFRRAA